jgi:proteic killer suppression protein
VEIASIRHKALRRLFVEGDTKGLIEPQRLIDMFSFIAITADFAGLAVPPNYGFHALTGNRKGTFAMTLTRNWRLTFVKQDDYTLAEMDIEDYH